MKKLYTLFFFLSIVTLGKAQVTPPYFEDFEGTPPWTDTTLNGSSWSVITPVGTVAHSGSKTLAIGYDGSNYQNNSLFFINLMYLIS